MTDGASSAASPETVAVNVSRDVGWNGSVSFEFQRNGDSTVLSTFNDDGQPDIGVWRGPVPVAELDGLLGRMRSSGYEHLPAPAAVPPGTKMISLGERRAGAQLPVMRAFASPPPAALAPVLAAVDALRRELRAHPLRVLRGAVTLETARIVRGKEVDLALTLTNAGTAPLTAGNPLSLLGGDWNGLRLMFARSGGGGSDQPRDLRASDLRAGPEAPRTPTVALPPGQSLRIEIRAPVDVAPGTYAVRLEYHGMVPPESDPHLVAGVLSLPAGTVVIEPAPWWRFW